MYFLSLHSAVAAANNKLLSILNDKVRVNTFFPVFSGLPDSGKSSFLNQFLNASSEQSIFDCVDGFDYGQFISVASSDATQSHYIRVKSNAEQCYYALLATLPDDFNFESLCLDDIVTSTLHGHLNAFYKSFVQFAKNDRMFSINQLKRGISIINIWDISINKALFSFLKCFNGCFANGHMFLFLDLKRDVPNLHKPPDIEYYIEGSQEMMWRSRLHYLLHSCKIFSQTNTEKKANACSTIFAKYSESCSPESIKKLKTDLEEEAKSAAKQIGVEELVNFKPILFCPQNGSAEDVCKRFEKLLLKQNRELISLAWIFLRGALDATQRVIITKRYLRTAANSPIFNFSECDEVDNFCEFFSSFGSIFCIEDFVVIRPIEFINKLNDLFCLSQCNEESLKYGIVTEEVAVDIFGTEVDNFLSILESIKFAIKIDVSRIRKDDVGVDVNTCSQYCYYIPSIRNGAPIQQLSKNAVHLYMDIASPVVNLDVAIASTLLDDHGNALLIQTTQMNATRIMLSPNALISLTSQGDVIEFRVTKTEEVVEMKKVCKSILKACKKVVMYLSDKKANPIKYNIGVLCEKDDYSDIPYNIHNLRHNLPAHFLCKKCFYGGILDDHVMAWNEALEEVYIR